MANNQGNTGNLHPMTGFYGDIHYLDEDAFYAQVIQAINTSKTTHQPVHLAGMIPMGTDNQKQKILEAIMPRLNADPTQHVAVWHHPGVNSSSTAADNTNASTYPVRQPDGSFRQETMETIVGGLVSGRFDTLETQGSVHDQRAFFASVRAFIGNVRVDQGYDVKEEGSVNFKESWGTGALATLKSLEEAFENMVLENMEPVKEEEDLVKGLGGMDVD